MTNLKVNHHNIINSLFFFISGFISFIPELKFIKYICVIYLLGYIIAKKSLFEEKYRGLNIVLFLFTFFILLSGYIADIKYGHYKWHVNVTSSILFVFQTMILFGYVEYIIKEKQQKEFLFQLLLILGFCLIIADIYIILNIKHIQDDTEAVYFIGNKFILSYSHILFLALFFSLRSCSVLIKLLLLFYCLFISKAIYCTTGIIGSLSFFILIICEKYAKKILYKRTVFYGCVLLSVCFALFIALFQDSIWFIKLMEILDESPSMNGRTGIYLQLNEVIGSNPYLGYGNGNSQAFVEYYTGIGNAQNGLLADIIDWGIIGVFFFLAIPYMILEKCKYNKYSYPILCFLYMYIIVAMVEVTMGLKFVAGLSLLLLSTTISQKGNGRLLKLLKFFILKKRLKIDAT